MMFMHTYHIQHCLDEFRYLALLLLGWCYVICSRCAHECVLYVYILTPLNLIALSIIYLASLLADFILSLWHLMSMYVCQCGWCKVACLFLLCDVQVVPPATTPLHGRVFLHSPAQCAPPIRGRHLQMWHQCKHWHLVEDARLDTMYHRLPLKVVPSSPRHPFARHVRRAHTRWPLNLRQDSRRARSALPDPLASMAFTVNRVTCVIAVAHTQASAVVHQHAFCVPIHPILSKYLHSLYLSWADSKKWWWLLHGLIAKNGGGSCYTF